MSTDPSFQSAREQLSRLDKDPALVDLFEAVLGRLRDEGVSVELVGHWDGDCAALGFEFWSAQRGMGRLAYVSVWNCPAKLVDVELESVGPERRVLTAMQRVARDALATWLCRQLPGED